MSILRWHIKENQQRVKRGQPPKDTPRYIKGPYKGLSRIQRRTDEAKLRHKGDTPHGLGKRKPRGWRRMARNRRKTQNTARRPQ